VCVAAPCYNIREWSLNRKRRQKISGVDLSHVDADPADIAKGLRLLANRNLIAVGRNVVIPDQGAVGDGLTCVFLNDGATSLDGLIE